MADITPPVSADSQIIQGYGDGGFRIAGQDYVGSVIVTALETSSWDITTVDRIDIDSLLTTLKRVPDLTVLQLGTGSSMTPPAPELRTKLRATGIGLEFMDTGAACRTFNVLLAEERSAAAALIAT
ncbi:MAG: hypothetical protein GKS01_16950 [Alphaproteobacteria bacterium]|nr:hypothetical protein [Alphaproteobacteria bacterium]